MHKIFAIISVLITGGLSIAMISATQAAYSVASNATNATEAVGSISRLASN